jgi:hypothetical protein
MVCQWRVGENRIANRHDGHSGYNFVGIEQNLIVTRRKIYNDMFCPNGDII